MSAITKLSFLVNGYVLPDGTIGRLQRDGSISFATCPYEGRFKVTLYRPFSGDWPPPDESMSDVLCRAHADDWLRQFPDAQVFEPRKYDETLRPCSGDWPLPAEVP